MSPYVAEERFVGGAIGSWAVYDPEGRGEATLPVIYGFVNGGPPDFLDCVLLAEDGEYLGGHCCSREFYAPGDLGCVAGTRPDRHEGFRRKYPSGYRMEFVRRSEIENHAGLRAALAKNRAAGEAVILEEERAEYGR